MTKLLKDWFSERDNVTMCVVRALLTSGGIVMIYKFVTTGGSYLEFAGGLSSIGTAIAIKNMSEKP